MKTIFLIKITLHKPRMMTVKLLQKKKKNPTCVNNNIIP